MTAVESSPIHEPNTYAAALVRAHDAYSSNVAFVGCDRSVATYAQVTEQAARFIGGLLSRGVKAGDRVLIALDNHVEALIVERAIMMWGLVRVAVSARLHPHEISWIAHDCDAKAILVEYRHLDGIDPSLRDRLITTGLPNPLWPTVEQLQETAPASPAEAYRTEAGDAAAIMYTSGTTGRPKGAVTTQGAWLSMAESMGDLLGADEEDVFFHAAPFSHFSGSVSTGFIIQGAAITTAGKVNASELPDELRKFEATCVPLVPTMIGDLIRAHEGEAELDLSHLRTIPYGGSAIDAPTLLAAQKLCGNIFVQLYGASEALIPITYLDENDHKKIGLETQVPAGRPLADVTIRICGDAASGPGEIMVRSPRTMIGYWGAPESTSEVLDNRGWYRTGDVGSIDENGRITIAGRTREVIISGGFNVYPSEVERVIRGVLGVADVAVVGQPHERWGEAVAAAIVVAAGSRLAVEDIVLACSRELADYKKPRLIKFVADLPRTSTGKIDKRTVKDLTINSAV